MADPPWSPRREPVRPAPVRRPRRRHRLGRRHGPGVVGVAGRHRAPPRGPDGAWRRARPARPRSAPERSAPVRHRRRRGLRADAGHRADRPRDRAGQRPGARGCPSPSAARAARFGSQRTVADGPRLDRPVLGANATGDAAIAYFQDLGGTDNDRVLVSLRRAGGSFGTPFQVGHGRDPLGGGGGRPARRRARRLGCPRDDPRPLPRARPAAASSPSRRSRRTRPSSPRSRPRSPTAGAATWPGARSSSPRAAPAGRCSTRSPCGRRATASAPPSSSSAMARTAARRRSRSRSPAAATPRSPGPASTARTPASGWRRPIPRRASARRRTSRPPAATGWSPISRPRRGTRLVVWDNGSFDANQVFAALAPPGAPFGAARGRLRGPGGTRRARGHGPRADRGVDQPARRLAPPGRPGRRADLRPGGDAHRIASAACPPPGP